VFSKKNLLLVYARNWIITSVLRNRKLANIVENSGVTLAPSFEMEGDGPEPDGKERPTDRKRKSDERDNTADSRWTFYESQF
jgi:hypothetical protein